MKFIVFGTILSTPHLLFLDERNTLIYLMRPRMVFLIMAEILHPLVALFRHKYPLLQMPRDGCLRLCFQGICALCFFQKWDELTQF